MGNNRDASQWGPNLYGYLEKLWLAESLNVHSWSFAHGFQPPTITRWKTGSIPSLQNMQSVADALNISMVDVLRIAGVISDEEANAPSRPAPVIAPKPSLESAIDNESTLDPSIRKHLRDILASFRAVQAGQIEEVSVKGKRKV